MVFRAPRLAVGVATVVLISSAGVRSQSPSPAVPPPAPVRPVADEYYGTTLTDPYRYMEDLKDPQVQAWIKAQSDYARAVLDRIPGRQTLLARMSSVRPAAPIAVRTPLPDGRFLVTKMTPSDGAVRFYLRNGAKGDDLLLVDPATVTVSDRNRARGKGRVAVRGFVASADGKYLVFRVIPGGAENDTELHVIDTTTRKETGDVILRAVGQETGYPAWLPDNRSFTYGRYQDLPPGAPATEEQQKYRTYLHVLGTDPAKDIPVFGYGVVPSIDVDPTLFATVQIPRGSTHAIGILTTDVSPANAYYIEPVTAVGTSNTSWHKMADVSDKVADVKVHGDNLYLRSFNSAPRFKILRLDARQPDLSTAEVVLPQQAGVMAQMVQASDALYVAVSDGGVDQLWRVPYGAKPKAQRVSLPFDGTLTLFTEPALAGVKMDVSTWIQSDRTYRYDPATQKTTDVTEERPEVFDRPGDLKSVEVKVRSADGTAVPLSIIYPSTIRFDGSNPAWLTGYGAYGFSETAEFGPGEVAWYERGGVRAVCHVRGGGEYGEAWHLGGKGSTKPNTWRDFIACAEYLIAKKYTSAGHLAAEGASAGGILVGRAITERPDLFGVAIIEVGLLDMVRFERTANGVSNIAEFGSTATRDGFDALLAMSAYHHVTDHSAYPAILLTTGMNDPRVDPWIPAKMAARLQAATSSGKPVLFSVNYGGGHSSDGLTAFEAQQADAWSFALWQFGLKEFQPSR